MKDDDDDDDIISGYVTGYLCVAEQVRQTGKQWRRPGSGEKWATKLNISASRV